MIRMWVRVHGRVQGVGFRHFTVQAARRLGVAGWVRNEPDGSVTCEVQGPRDAVDAFLDAVGQGPRFARVDDVATEHRDPEPDAVAFGVHGSAP